MTDMNEVILKADRRGRLRYTPEQKQAFVAAYESSGLSCPRFAALHGIKYQTLVSSPGSVRSSQKFLQSIDPFSSLRSRFRLSTRRARFQSLDWPRLAEDDPP
jgi:hypothetical protein